MLPTVTRRFIEGIIRSGRLTEARQRHESGTAVPCDWSLASRSCWSLVCEEVIDTDHEASGYDAVYGELIRRQFLPGEIDAMPRLAWKTAGWMNYDMMLWDWTGLDEADMRTALEWQLQKRRISKAQHDEEMLTIACFLDRDADPKQ